MGFYATLLDKKGNICQVERHTEGGTYVIGGTTDADLYITYNYSKFFHKAVHKEQGLQFLNGKKAKDVIKILKKAIKMLGTIRDKNYWKSTKGNAGHVLSILLKWAEQHPEAMFKVT